MATRTLQKFRAEYEIWRKDLAKILEMPEEELEQLETMDKVPPEIAQKLIAAYTLPADYFTVDVDAAAAEAREAQKLEPAAPFRYFFVVALVWHLLVQVVNALVLIPTSIFAALDFTVAPFFNNLESLCATVITLVSGIYLSSYIRKKTKYRGDIINYEFLYPYLSGMVISCLSSFSTLFAAKILDPANYFMNEMILSVPALIVTLLVGAWFTATHLQAAVMEPGKKKDKTLLVLCCVALASRILAGLFISIANDFTGQSFWYYFNTVLSVLLLAAVAAGILLGSKKKPQLNKVWFTALPVVAMILPQCISMIAALAA